MAKEAGMYEFLLHMTQGFQRFEDHWCQECLLEAGIWWECKELTATMAPNRHEELKAKASAELDRRRERSKKSREERQAWRELREETAPARPKPTNPRPRPVRENIPVHTPVVNTGPGYASGSVGQQQRQKETPKQQEESSFLQTTGKILGTFGRWVATGKVE